MADEKRFEERSGDMAQFVPSLVYEKDSEFVDRYREYCVTMDIRNVLDEDEHEDYSDEDDSDSSSSSTESKDDIHLSRRIINSPPLYDREDHFHPCYQRDFQMYHFTSTELKDLRFQAMLPARMLAPGNLLESIRNETLSMIQNNREHHALVKTALKSVITLPE
jgi:hypothetical protein